MDKLLRGVFLSVLPWMKYLPDGAVVELVEEMTKLLRSGDDVGAAVQCLIEWRHTAEIYADPDLCAALTRTRGDLAETEGDAVTRLYVLNEEGSPVPEEDFLAWTRWLADNAERCVIGRDKIDSVTVATSFVGEHSGSERADAPVVWCTLIEESADMDLTCAVRYSAATEHAARQYHSGVVELLRSGMPVRKCVLAIAGTAVRAEIHRE